MIVIQWIEVFYFLVQPESTINPQTERWKLVSEENQRLQHELSDIHRKFETLNTRNDERF